MKNRSLAFVAAFALLFVAPQSGFAAPSIILEYEYSDIGGSNIASDPRTSTVFLLTSDTAHTHDQRSAVFSGITLKPALVGTTFIANAANDPGFANTVAYFTDGIDDFAGERFTGFSGSSYPESALFGSVPGGNGIDLRGFNIDHFTLTLTDFHFETPGRNPNHDGQWTDHFIILNVAIYGAPVPEPGSFALLATGAAGLLLWARRRKR